MKKKCVEEEIAEKFRDILDELKVGNYLVKYLKKGDEGFVAEDSVMAVSVNYPYKEVNFSVGQKAIDMYKKKSPELRICLLHEVAHVIHWRYAHLAEHRNTSKKELDDEEEQLADTWALILNRLWK